MKSTNDLHNETIEEALENWLDYLFAKLFGEFNGMLKLDRLVEPAFFAMGLENFI